MAAGRIWTKNQVDYRGLHVFDPSPSFGCGFPFIKDCPHCRAATGGQPVQSELRERLAALAGQSAERLRQRLEVVAGRG